MSMSPVNVTINGMPHNATQVASAVAGAINTGSGRMTKSSGRHSDQFFVTQVRVDDDHNHGITYEITVAKTYGMRSGTASSEYLSDDARKAILEWLGVYTPEANREDEE